MEERSVLRVVLPGTSFPLVKQGAVAAAKEAKRPLRSSDYEIVSENQIAAFTPAEWAALPEITKARFGYISQSDVQAVALAEMQKPIDEWNARIASKEAEIKRFEGEIKATELRLSQQMQSLRNDLGFLQGEANRITNEKAKFEAKVQAEIDSRAQPVFAAIPADMPNPKGGKR